MYLFLSQRSSSSHQGQQDDANNDVRHNPDGDGPGAHGFPIPGSSRRKGVAPVEDGTVAVVFAGIEEGSSLSTTRLTGTQPDLKK